MVESKAGTANMQQSHADSSTGSFHRLHGTVPLTLPRHAHSDNDAKINRNPAVSQAQQVSASTTQSSNQNTALQHEIKAAEPTQAMVDDLTVRVAELRLTNLINSAPRGLSTSARVTRQPRSLPTPILPTARSPLSNIATFRADVGVGAMRKLTNVVVRQQIVCLPTHFNAR